MKFSELTDFEINCAVAGFLGREFFNNGKPDDSGRRRKSYEIDGKHRDVSESGWTSEAFDPCNSWADAGPIIEKHGITVACYKNHKSDAWCSANGIVNGFIVEHENPLRAAMEVFLMMQEQPTTDTYRQIENDGWIDWGGGKQPIANDRELAIKFRDGTVMIEAHSDCWVWSHGGDDDDIIAYRVIENDGREG